MSTRTLTREERVLAREGWIHQRNVPSPVLATWLAGAALTLTAWLSIVAQFVSHRHLEEPAALPSFGSYATLGFGLTGAIAVSAFILGRVISRLISSEDSMRRLALQMQNLAERDMLTDLPNRHFLLSHLRLRIADQDRPECLSILFIDLDNFKFVNDSLGHQYGDELLKNVAIRLRRIAGGDRILARIGGDEFVIVVEGARARDDAASLAEAIIKGFEIGFALRGSSYVIGLSIGIATSAGDDLSEFDLLTRADLAMYSAKRVEHQAPRGRYREYSPDLSAEAMRNIERQQDLQYAIRDREFVLDYRAIFESDGRMLAGAESILTWRHPEYGALGSRDFLPFAERSGYAGPIFLLTLEMALEQFCEWKTREKDVPAFVSIKAPVSVLLHGEVAAALTRALFKYEVEPDVLYVEFAEKELHDNWNEARASLGRLRSIGIRILVDAFGASIGSIAILQSRLVNAVRIDPCFFRIAGSVGSERAIFEAVVALCTSSDISVIVDGVSGHGMDRMGQSRGVYFQGDVPCPPSKTVSTLDLPT